MLQERGVRTRRTGRLDTFRFAVAGVALVLLILAMEVGRWQAQLALILLAGACLLNLLGLIARRRARDLEDDEGEPVPLTGWALLSDFGLVSAIVYLTGGVYSFGALLYFAVVLAASLSISQRSGILLASGATCALAAIQLGYYLSAQGLWDLPLVPKGLLQPERLRLRRDAAYLIAQCLALHMVAALGGWLSRELEHVRILYGEILERMAEGLVVVDRGGRLVFVNNEARDLLGYRSAEVLTGREVREVFRRQADRELLDLLEQPEPVTVELEVATRGGRRAVRVRTTILRDDRGVFRGTIGLFTDLTLHRQVEEALRRADRLEELRTLALGIAHEVRNPLASIRGCAQELGREALPEDDVQQLVRIVCRESDRLDGIVQGFMRFARLPTPVPEAFDLVRLAEDVAILLRNRDEGAAHRVERTGLDEALAEADRDLIQQVLVNIGLNALQAMEPEGGRLEIHVKRARVAVPQVTPEGARASAAARLVEVEGFAIDFLDEGPGVPEDALDRIFVPFYTTKPGGTGLGLPMAARIVRAHGELTVARRDERGSIVSVRLPAEYPYGQARLPERLVADVAG